MCVSTKYIPWSQWELFACTHTIKVLSTSYLFLSSLQTCYKLFWMCWLQSLHNNQLSTLFNLQVTLLILQAVKHGYSANYPGKHWAPLKSFWVHSHLLRFCWSAFSPMCILSNSPHQQEDEGGTNICQVMSQSLLLGPGLYLRRERWRWREGKPRWSSRMKLGKETET